MDSYQARRFGDPPFPSPPYPHLQQQQQQQQQQHFPGQQPANYPPAYHFPPYPPAPAPHSLQHQHNYGAALPPPYDASAPFHQQHYQYPPPGPAAAPPLSRPHHMPPFPTAPPPQPVLVSDYPTPPNQVWVDPSWSQRQGLEYTDKNFPYKEDDWAAKAKAWAAAKSVTENPLMHSKVMADGRVEEQNLYFHEQNQHVMGPPAGSQQPPHLPSSQHQPFYVDQEKQATGRHGPSSYTFGSPYVDHNSDSVAAHEDRLSAATNYASNAFIHEQEVPYSYSSISGKPESVHRSESLQQSVPFRAQEGSFSLQSALPDYAHGENSRNFVTDISNKPLEFEPRYASGPDIAGGMRMMDHGTMGNTLNSWAPSAVPGHFPQALPSSVTQFNPHFASPPSLPVKETPVFGVPSGSSIRPRVQSVSAEFVPGTGGPINQAIGYSTDANGSFGLTERPKKAAVPKWLREEIMKSRVAVASSYTNQTGPSNDYLEDEYAARSCNGIDKDNSTDSTKSIKDDEDDEDVVETARSTAVNQEIKRILTEVLLKVTDEFFDQIATKVLDEDDPTMEAREHRTQRVNLPPAFKLPAASEVLTSVKENSSNSDDVNYKFSSPALGGGLLGLVSYASEDDDEDERNRGSRSPASGTMVRESNGGSDRAGAKSGENGNVDIVDYVENCEALDYVETKGSHMHTNASPETHIMNDVLTISKQNVTVPVELCNEKVARVFKDIGQSEDATDQKESKSVEHMSADAKDSKLASIIDDVSEPKGSLAVHSYLDKKSYSKDSVCQVTTNKEKKINDSNETKFTSNKEQKNIESIGTPSHEKKIELKKMEKTYSLKDKNDNGTQAGEFDSRRNQSSVKDARRHSTKDSNESQREDTQKDKVKSRNEKEQRTRRHTKDSDKYSTRSPSPSKKSRHSKESLPHDRRNILNDEPYDNSRKRQLSRSPERKHSHHKHSYSTSRRR